MTIQPGIANVLPYLVFLHPFHHFFCCPPVSLLETFSWRCLRTDLAGQSFYETSSALNPSYYPGLVENTSTPAWSGIILGVIAPLKWVQPQEGIDRNPKNS